MCGPRYVRSGPVIPSSAKSSDSSENLRSSAFNEDERDDTDD